MGMGLHLGYEGLKTGLRQAYEGERGPNGKQTIIGGCQSTQARRTILDYSHSSDCDS